MFRLRLLGQPALYLGQAALNLPTRKLWGLLAYSSVQAPLPRKKIAELLWENQNEERSRANLRQELYRLRGSKAEGLFVSLEDQLSLAAHTSDLAEFAKCLEAQDWAGALEHYQGEFAQGLQVRGAAAFEDWLALEREHWAGLWQQAAKQQASLWEASGQLVQANALYTRILQHDPFQEDLQRASMRLTAQLEGAALALKVFGRYKALLQKEFSLTPLPQTMELAERLASGQPSSEDARAAGLATLGTPRLVGRERQWAALEAAWQKGQAIYLSGPAGVGKTRLMLEFAASKGPYLHFEARQSDSGVSYGYLARVLRPALEMTQHLPTPAWMGRELSRLYPELGQDPPPMTSETDKLRLFEALTELVRRSGQVGIVAIASDDLQLVRDAASMEFLGYSLERLLPTRTLRFISTFRPDELEPAALGGIQEQVRQGRAVQIELDTLDELGTAQFVQTLSGQAAPLFSRRLYQSTGGNPLFMLETIRSLLSTGEIQIEEGRWYTRYDQETQNYRELPIPGSVREAVWQRVSRLGGGVQRLLEAASLAGEGFSLEELAGATALSEWETLEALEVAQKAGLLKQAAGRYDFSHDLIRKAISESLSAGRARLLQQKLALALERSGGAPGRIAYHLEQAGQAASAIAWRIRAAQQATQVFALAEALEHYAKALDDGADPPTAFTIRKARSQLWADLSDFQQWAEELEQMGRLAAHRPDLEVQTALARIQLAERASRYQEALDTASALLASDIPAPYRHQALSAKGKALLQLGKTGEAKDFLEQALADSPELAEPKGSIHISLLVCNERLGDLNQALLHGHQALKAAQEDSLVRIQAIDSIGRIHLRQGQYRQALQYFNQALSLAQGTNHVYMQRQILLNLYGAYYHLDDFESGIACLEEGLSLTQAPQDPLTEGTFLNNLGFAYRQRGELGKALQHIRAAIAISDRIAMPFQQAWRRITLADLLLEVGAKAHPLLSEARELIASANLHPLNLWYQAVWARAELQNGQADTGGLEASVSSGTGSLADRDRACWILGLVRLAQGNFSGALAAVQDLHPSASMRSRGLAVELRARKALGQPLEQAIQRAEELLKSGKLPALESLELRQALLGAVKGRKASQHQQIAQHQAQTLLESLRDYPELQQTWLGVYPGLLS